MLYKGAYTVYLFAKVVHARTEYGSLHLYGVGIAWKDRIYADGVAVIHTETGEVELFYIIYCIFPACLAVYSNRLLVGITRKTAGIFEDGVDTLVLLHLVNHRALYLTRYGDEAVVWANYDDIVVAQADIACQLSIENVVVDINHGNESVVAIYLDVTQGSEIVGSACHVESMEYGGEG